MDAQMAATFSSTDPYHKCYFPSTWTDNWLFSAHGLGLLATTKA